jgi:hypothetical protein
MSPSTRDRFGGKPEQPDFDRLLVALNNSDISVKNNALYQTIKGLMDKVRQMQGITVTDINELQVAIDNLTNIVNNINVTGVEQLPRAWMPVFDGEDGIEPLMIPGRSGRDGLDGKTIPGMDGIDYECDPLIPFGPFTVPSATSSFSYTEQTTTSTGTQNDFSLSAHYTVLRCNNATALTITGFSVGGATPTAGDQVVIENIGSSTVRVAHNDGGSTAAFQVTCPSTRGQILGANGSMRLVYDGTTTKWRLAAVQPGAPITPTFAAGDFTASGAMTWTVAAGDVTVLAYSQLGKLVTIMINLVTTTVGGAASTQLKILIPNSFTANSNALNTCLVSDNGAFGAGYLITVATQVVVGLISTGNWAAAADNTAVQGFLTFEVQ